MQLHHRFAAKAGRFCLIAALCLVPTRAGAAEGLLTLRWTAPGDDGMLGLARHYVLRYSTAPLTEANFNQATEVPNLPAPLPPGSGETCTITGLVPGQSYYVALKTLDEAGNSSPLSNVLLWPARLVGVDEPQLALEFSPAWPNPARSAIRCAYALPEPGAVEVDVFDPGGRLVRTLARGSRPAGRGAVDWDLRDTAGRRVAAGLYLVHARVAGQTWTRRVTVMP